MEKCPSWGSRSRPDLCRKSLAGAGNLGNFPTTFVGPKEMDLSQNSGFPNWISSLENFETYHTHMCCGSCWKYGLVWGWFGRLNSSRWIFLCRNSTASFTQRMHIMIWNMIFLLLLLSQILPDVKWTLIAWCCVLWRLQLTFNMMYRKPQAVDICKFFSYFSDWPSKNSWEVGFPGPRPQQMLGRRSGLFTEEGARSWKTRKASDGGEILVWYMNIPYHNVYIVFFVVPYM